MSAVYLLAVIFMGTTSIEGDLVMLEPMTAEQCLRAREIAIAKFGTTGQEPRVFCLRAIPGKDNEPRRDAPSRGPRSF